MDEMPPTDLRSSYAPDAPSPYPPRKPFAKRAAKLALWSPFVGLVILGVSIATVGQTSGGNLRPMIASIVVAVCWLIWVAGFVLGIMALRRSTTVGRTGVFGRALIGMTLNLLLLSLTIWGTISMVGVSVDVRRLRDVEAEREAAHAKTNVGDGEDLQKKLRAVADHEFAANLLELQKKYLMSWGALTNPPVLDMAQVKTSVRGGSKQ